MMCWRFVQFAHQETTLDAGCHLRDEGILDAEWEVECLKLFTSQYAVFSASMSR